MKLYEIFLRIDPGDSYYIVSMTSLHDDAYKLGAVYERDGYDVILYGYTNKKSIADRFMAARDNTKFYEIVRTIDKDVYSTLIDTYPSYQLDEYYLSSKPDDLIPVILSDFEITEINDCGEGISEICLELIYPFSLDILAPGICSYTEELAKALYTLGYSEILEDPYNGDGFSNRSGEFMPDEFFWFIYIFGDTLRDT